MKSKELPKQGQSELPAAIADSLGLNDEYGGFMVIQSLGQDRYALLLGGLYNVLVREARLAADRAFSAFQQRDVGGETGAAASALLCAAAACEARLSEYLAHYEVIGGPLPDELEKCRQNPNAREQWRDLLRFRVPTFDLGVCSEYLALACLFRLRDTVAHRSARLAMPGAVPDSIADCVRQLGIPLRDRRNRDWTSALLVHEVATWGVDVAEAWIKLVDEVAPIHC
jgi:hypothetical protein